MRAEARGKRDPETVTVTDNQWWYGASAHKLCLNKADVVVLSIGYSSGERKCLLTHAKLGRDGRPAYSFKFREKEDRDCWIKHRGETVNIVIECCGRTPVPLEQESMSALHEAVNADKKSGELGNSEWTKLIKTNLKEIAPPDLLSLYCTLLDELRKRGIVRSTNNPVADYAERLISSALNLQLEMKSTTGFDATDNEGNRYEIKARRLTLHNKSRQLSAIRGLDKNHFNYLAGVLFAEDFSVQRACLIPISVVQRLSVYRQHVNAWILHLRDPVWEVDGVKDITDKVRTVKIA